MASSNGDALILRLGLRVTTQGSKIGFRPRVAKFAGYRRFDLDTGLI